MIEYIIKKKLHCPYCGATAEYVDLILKKRSKTAYSQIADLYGRWECMSDDCGAIFHDLVRL